MTESKLTEENRKPTAAGWSIPPTEEASHPERLSVEHLALAGNALSEWAYEHLSKGYGVCLTVREVARLLDAARTEGRAEGYAAAVAVLRGMSNEHPPPSLWHAAGLLASSLESRAQPSQALEASQ